MRNLRTLLWLALATFVPVYNIQAGIVVPNGLSPGDKYYLAFVTRDQHHGLSDSLATYDAFVQSQAALAPSYTGANDGVKWRVIGSVATETAASHLALTSAPMYLLDGTTIVKQHAQDIWTTGTLDAPLSLTQFLQSPGSIIWTGTNAAGGVYNTNPLGTYYAIAGAYSAVDFRWICGVSGPPAVIPASFYAVSELLTVPNSSVIPEPSTLAMLGTVAVWTAHLWLKRRQAKAA